MKVDAQIALEVASHEALVRQAYKDSVGVLTWCVGMTNATGHTVERYIGKPANLQHCMNVYAWALENYASGVRKAFDGVKLTKEQFAAALSFHWNTGAIGKAAWVTHFKAGNIVKARSAFMDWNKPASIIARRAKERDLFFDGKWSNDGTMTEFTRVHDNLSPDWSSAKRINVARELERAFELADRPIIDQPPKPNQKAATPTLSPERVPVSVRVTKAPNRTILDIFGHLFKRSKTMTTKPGDTVRVEVESAWASKVNWTMALGFIFTILTWFGVPMDEELKVQVIALGNSAFYIIGWVFRTFFSPKVPAPSVKN